MGLDLARRDLDRIYSSLDRMYGIVTRLLEDTIRGIGEWREVDGLEDKLYIVETLMGVVEEQATFFIAKYQPLGPELLEAKSLIRASYDLYRIARYCREINRVIAYTSSGGLKHTPSVAQVTTIVREMVEDAYRAYRHGDGEARRRVAEKDNQVDTAYTRMLARIGREETLTRGEVVDLLILRHLERIADHAVYLSGLTGPTATS